MARMVVNIQAILDDVGRFCPYEEKAYLKIGASSAPSRLQSIKNHSVRM
ncbi:hypothetical protein GCM10011391_05020 [Pullulanibacillus camelliae]|uniref:Uncharacterized protein n=1 Tax=Pullulanibacillus camelliae TaxID=1707096 RepID=A0A8J2VL34_9BACL|nr:hypothetical protein GCM10011391_05020 [Pullulanibacillus camelliae]